MDKFTTTLPLPQANVRQKAEVLADESVITAVGAVIVQCFGLSVLGTNTVGSWLGFSDNVGVGSWAGMVAQVDSRRTKAVFIGGRRCLSGWVGG